MFLLANINTNWLVTNQQLADLVNNLGAQIAAQTNDITNLRGDIQGLTNEVKRQGAISAKVCSS